MNKTLLKRSLILNTERLSLHSFSDDDLKEAIDIFKNEEVSKTYMLPSFSSDDQMVGLFRRMKDLSLDDSWVVYGAYLDNRLVGFINDVASDDTMIEVGYVIHPLFQNQGLATEMLTAAIEELFRIGYSEVRAGFFEENTASLRVMEKCGMHLLEYSEDIEYRGQVHHCFYCSISRTK